MDHPFDRTSRRSFLGLGVTAAALATLESGAIAQEPKPSKPGEIFDPWAGLKMGIATYTFSKLSLDDAIKGVKRVDLAYASIKDAHLPLKSTAQQRKDVVKKFQDAGITVLSCGVITPGEDEASIRNMFEYAQDAGIPTIVCKPSPASLSTLDKFVKDFNIKVAIHNHGPEDKVWPSPLGVWDAIQPFDPRIGVCIDVGHTARCGVDPVEAIRKCAPRLLDMHIKDIAVATGGSKPVELGRGVLNLKGILQALLDVNFSGHLGLEFEKDLKDPIPGTAESIGYLKGLMKSMK